MEATKRLHLVPRDQMLEFAFGGNAHFTMVNTGTGEHRVYHIWRKKQDVVLCVSQEIEYGTGEMLGTIRDGKYIPASYKSKDHEDKVFAFHKLVILLQENRLNPIMDMYHHGTCGKCGRRLTSPESIELGIGPECRGKK